MSEKNTINRSVLYLGVVALSLLLVGCTTAPVVTDVRGAAFPHSLTVVGYGTASGIPDMAVIQLGVNILDEDVGAGVAEANAIIASIKAAVLEKGVIEKDIQTTNFNVWPEDRYDPQTGFPSGERLFHIDGTVQVKVREVGSMGDVLSAALAAGANNVFGISFGIEDTTGLATEARSIAILDARSKAEQLADNMGASLGDPIVVSEGVLDDLVPISYAIAESGIGIGGGGAAPISPGQSSVSVQVQITFELVP